MLPLMSLACLIEQENPWSGIIVLLATQNTYPTQLVYNHRIVGGFVSFFLQSVCSFKIMTHILEFLELAIAKLVVCF